MSGSQVVMGLVKSYYSPMGSYNNKVSGLDAYKYLSELLSDFESEFSKLKDKLIKLYKKIFNSKDLIISSVGKDEDLDNNKKALEKYINNLNRQEFKKLNTVSLRTIKIKGYTFHQMLTSYPRDII